jgi:hypothetical protein
LLRWAVDIERPAWVIAPDRVYAHVAVGYGRAPLELVASKPLVRPVRRDLALAERVVAPTSVSLPIRRGQRLGAVRVFSGGRLIGARALVAARSVDTPGTGGKLGFYTRRTFHHIGGWFS